MAADDITLIVFFVHINLLKYTLRSHCFTPKIILHEAALIPELLSLAFSSSSSLSALIDTSLFTLFVDSCFILLPCFFASASLVVSGPSYCCCFSSFFSFENCRNLGLPLKNCVLVSETSKCNNTFKVILPVS